MIIDILHEIDEEYMLSSSIEFPNKFYKLTDSIIDIVDYLPANDKYKKQKIY